MSNQQRKFGVTVGAAFVGLGILAGWRGHAASAPLLGGVGALLLVTALLAPALLGPVERTWMGLAKVISKITTPIFMGIVYLVLITPIGILRRTFGSDPLAPAQRAGRSRWVSKAPPARDAMQHQF